MAFVAPRVLWEPHPLNERTLFLSQSDMREGSRTHQTVVLIKEASSQAHEICIIFGTEGEPAAHEQDELKVVNSSSRYFLFFESRARIYNTTLRSSQEIQTAITEQTPSGIHRPVTTRY